MNAPADPAFASRCRESFARQKAMTLIGARLTIVDPGYVEIELPWRAELTQQKGYVHGGIVGMIADTACGYSAFSLMPADCYAGGQGGGGEARTHAHGCACGGVR